MQKALPFSGFQLNRTEVCFFLTIFLVFPVITDFEYNLYERTGSGPAVGMLLERLMYGILGMIPYVIYYKCIIPYLFEKRYLAYAVLVSLFLVLLDFSMWLDYWIVSKLAFLPEQTVLSAARWLDSAPVLFRFSIVFVFREMLMMTALAYFMRSSRQEKQLHTLHQQQLETELNYLKVQLQPHFFFNTLNNIYSLALQQSDQTAPLVARYAEMMRYILYHSKKRTVDLGREIEFLKNYAEVESMRYPAGTKIHFDTQGIDNSVRIEPLLLLPFIENAFKHGLREEVKSGFVDIVIFFYDGELVLEVVNSKPADLESDHQVKGTGLENAVSRLNLLYPAHKLKIHETMNRYEVKLSLTLQPYGEMLDCK